MSKMVFIANPGSTSLKFKLYQFPEEIIIASGKIERIGSDKSVFSFKSETSFQSGEEKISDYNDGITKIMDFLTSSKIKGLKTLDDLAAVGFKAVHAGKLGRGPGAVQISGKIINEMEKMLVVAPAHNRAYIDVIRCFKKLHPQIPLAALFEPAFHTYITEEKATFGIPIEWKEKYGIRKYGFHGASHRYISETAPEIMKWDDEKKRSGKIISCHLGGSSSLCAIKNGKSVDTTMTFSPQSGILHSNRCETIDPFIIIFAQKVLGYSVDELSNILCKKSGLAGISNTSGDIRDLKNAAQKGRKESALALKVFYYQVRREIASMASSLEGVDAIIFTGGIGENGADERSNICKGLNWLGIEFDEENNSRVISTIGKISTDSSKVEIWVIPTNEELIVGREIYKLFM